jgi:AcrR family transcriptional regulator
VTKADLTRRRILDAALAEFSAHGIAGARVDRIARAAGCNKNLIYVYFESKETLFATILGKHLSRVYEELPFTPDDLPGFAGRVFDFAMEHPDLLRLIAWSALERTGGRSPSRVDAHRAKVDAVAQRQASGDLDTSFSAAFLMTAVMAMATAWSPAFPFGTAPEMDDAAARDELRAQVAAAIARLLG